MFTAQRLRAECRNDCHRRFSFLRDLPRKHVLIPLALIVLTGSGCARKTAPPITQAPPAPARTDPVPPPTEERRPPAIAEFTVEPTSILRSQSATLRWEVTGEVSSVSINQEIGAIQMTGSRKVTPANSITYVLTATGAGGTTKAMTTVRVTAPPPPVRAAPAASPASIEREFAGVEDIYYDYDRSEIRADGRDALLRDAAILKMILKDAPDAEIVLEGHSDERGSAEYNLGLADRRSNAAKQLLIDSGISPEHLRLISFGKERPQCIETNEYCWQQNRRVHFTLEK
jgi:peptidoglycan-associated lipoprotein